jgi:hypothetical protein
VQLEIYLQVWKTVQKILLCKLDKPDYIQIKVYQMISLLNCLEKVIEKIIADIIAAYYKAAGVLYTDQIEC